MAYSDLKSVFDDYTDFKVDKQFIQRIFAYVQGFVNKNDEHTAFFGGHLIGVNRATFLDDVDGNRWLEEICGIDSIDDCRDDIFELKDINPKWHVSSDIINLSFLYVAHRLQNSHLPAKDKENAIIYTIIMAHAKHLTSGLRKRFQFTANPEIAMATFEALDYRSDLKKYGSWFALLHNRGEQVVGPKFVHKKTLDSFQKTYDVMRWANDLQDRLSDVLTTLTSRFHDVKDSSARITSASRITEYEGIKEIRSYRNVQRELVAGIKRVAVDRNDFIRPALIEDVMEVVNTADPRLLRETLEYIVDDYTANERYAKVMEEIVVYMFDQAKSAKIDLSDIPALVNKFRSIYRSSQTQRSDIRAIKVQINDIVLDAIPRARPSLQVATKIALFIYLTLRIITLPKDKA